MRDGGQLVAKAAGRPHRVAAVATAIACIAAAGGSISCRRPAPPAPAPVHPRLDSIQIEDATAPSEHAAGLDVAAIAAALRKTLRESRLVDVPGADSQRADAGPAGASAASAPVLRIAGRVGFEPTEVDSKGIVRAGVSLRLSTRPSDAPGALNEDLTAAGERPYDVRPGVDRTRLGQELVERTAVDLLSGLLARVGLATATPAQIHAAIAADGGVLRGEAIRVAGARGLRDEVPSLLRLLQNDEEAVRDAALGALIALKERRAVTELTRNRSLRDRREMRKVLEAVSILGGEEAANYLAFVAESHDDEEIRKLAADAKTRMERRSPSQPERP